MPKRKHRDDNDHERHEDQERRDGQDHHDRKRRHHDDDQDHQLQDRPDRKHRHHHHHQVEDIVIKKEKIEPDGDRRRIGHNRGEDDRRNKNDGNVWGKREDRRNQKGGDIWGKKEDRRNQNGGDVWGKKEDAKVKDEKKIEKEKPDFKTSGKLAEDTNTFRGVVIKYNEPPEARKPKKKWRLYPFKGDDTLPILHLHRQSAFLLGRDRRVADIPVDHPSCSKQHAALQFRLVPFERPDGTVGRRVRPYVIDLGSANGTYVNNKRIDAQRYVELFEKDVLKFGFSKRDYVLLHDSSNTDPDDEDVTEKD